MKNFGSAAAVTCRGLSIDSAGSIYIAGGMQSYNSTQFGYFDADTTLGYETKSMYVVKYDSSGNLQWLKRPEPVAFDVTSGTNGVFGFIGIDVSKSGDVFLFGFFSQGVYESGVFTIPKKGYYILKYDRNGVYKSLIPVDMSTTDGGFSYNVDGQANLFTAKFAKDFGSNRYFIYGQYFTDRGTLKIGDSIISGTGGTMGYPIFLAAFDASGDNIWVKQSSEDGYTIHRDCKPAIDNLGNVYIGGDASPQAGNSFNGHFFVNSDISYMPVPFVISLDTNGNNRWVSTGTPNNAINGSALAYRNNKVWMGGAYTDKLSWGKFSLNTDVGAFGGYLPFLISFNSTTGAVLSLDTLVASPVFNEPTALTIDRNNNVFMGG